VSTLLDVAAEVISALDACDIRYSVGGSLASALAGEPRASLDVDIVVDLDVNRIPTFVQALGDGFYADPDVLARAATAGSTANLIHHASGIKVDLFVAASALERRQLERRRLVAIGERPARRWFVHTAEDILLQKLWWFRQGGEVSERQWRDVVGILLVQEGRLDEPYLLTVAHEVGLGDLLERARRDAGR
jgi:hypothetical protein